MFPVSSAVSQRAAAALGSVRVAAARMLEWEIRLMMALGAAGARKSDVQKGETQAAFWH